MTKANNFLILFLVCLGCSDVLAFTPLQTTMRKDRWVEESSVGRPDCGYGYPALARTPTELLIWGGKNAANTATVAVGGRFNLSTKTWSTITATNAPPPKAWPFYTWTGTEMIVWGGWDGAAYTNTGKRFDPAANTWTNLPANGLAGRYSAGGSGVLWSGTQFFVWGGHDGPNYFRDGSLFTPSSGAWSAITTTNAPTSRVHYGAAWTGSRFFVWGGAGVGAVVTATGGLYNPSGNSWTATATLNAPSARRGACSVWTGSHVIIYGGYSGAVQFRDGALYNPTNDTWSSMAPSIALQEPRCGWTGKEMVVWGGSDVGLPSGQASIAFYNPTNNSWRVGLLTGARTSVIDQLFLMGSNDFYYLNVAVNKFFRYIFFSPP